MSKRDPELEEILRQLESISGGGSEEGEMSLEEIMKQLESLSGGDSKGSEEEADLKDILEALEKLEGTEEAEQEPDEDLMAYLPADQAFSEMLDLFARENRLPRDRLEERILAYLRERLGAELREEDRGEENSSSTYVDLWKDTVNWHPLYKHLREEIEKEILELPKAPGLDEGEDQTKDQVKQAKPLVFLVPFEGFWMPYSSVGFLRRVLREGTVRAYFVPWEYEGKEAVLALAFAMRDHAGVHAALKKVAEQEGVSLEEALSALAKEEPPRPSPHFPEFWQELERHVQGVEQKMKKLRRLLPKAAEDEGLVAELMRLGEEAAVLEKRLEELYSLLKSSRKKASTAHTPSS